MRLFNYLLAASVFLGACVGPALAEPHHGYRENNNNSGNSYNNGNNGYRSNRNKHWKKKYRKSMRRNNANNYSSNNWNDERGMYSSNWNRPNAQARMRYDAQMRENWLRYKNNNYNGNYSWSTYNDPQFIDYLHNNNPSLLTNIRSVLGF